MAFENLSGKLQDLMRKLKGKSRITEDDVKEIVTIEGTDAKEGWVALPKEGQFYLLVESEGTSKSGDFKFDLKSYSDLAVA